MKYLLLTVLSLSSVAFAAENMAWIVVPSESETECKDIEKEARIRINQAQNALSIEPGTLGLGAQFIPESISYGTCTPDGDGMLSCGSDTVIPAACRLSYISDGVRWVYKKVKTAKVNGKERQTQCQLQHAEMEKDPSNLFLELKKGGIFKRHCRVESLRLEVLQKR